MMMENTRAEFYIILIIYSHLLEAFFRPQLPSGAVQIAILPFWLRFQLRFISIIIIAILFVVVSFVYLFIVISFIYLIVSIICFIVASIS
ncbi:hypothetical protein BT96DRAFT_52122 [Gymnopus androsaceus JB14]|uniref:Uncharacterized protein n=1 Tax=Gymnopus androsaceus JB14 TaxID=1447944 RepID=A0A6A4IBB3_9AGAR|nr:hypothetical protein BT96DRAFT_52122 [Gymnopus androsaceus JB14]